MSCTTVLSSSSILTLLEALNATDAQEKAPAAQKARRPTVVPVHRVQAVVRRPLQPTVGTLKALHFPQSTGPCTWGKTEFTAVHPAQKMEGAEETLGRDYRRIAPEKEVGEWRADAAAANHRHVVLIGRSWSKARAMAGEAMAKWSAVEEVSSVHLVPPKRGAAETTAAALVAVGANGTKIRLQGMECRAQLLCQRLEWDVEGGGPPVTPEGHVLVLTWRRAAEKVNGGMEALMRGLTTPAGDGDGTVGLWCHLQRHQLLPQHQQEEAKAPPSQQRLQRWAKEEVWSHLQGGCQLDLPMPPIMDVRQADGSAETLVELQLPLAMASKAMWWTGSRVGVGFRPHLGGNAARGVDHVVHRVAVPVELQGMGVQHWWGKLQASAWFGGLTPDSTPRKLGIRCWGTERRGLGEVGREAIGAILEFEVPPEKVRVRVYGYPTSFQYAARAEVRRLVGPEVRVVGAPTHMASSGMRRPIFDMWLSGVPDGWTGGVMELSPDSRTPPKRYVLVESAPKAATVYRAVARSRALPRPEPPAPAPLQDEGGADDVVAEQAESGGNGEDDGMSDGSDIL